MNVATIEIEQEKAQHYFEQYREAVRSRRHEDRRAEDEMMVKAFKAAAKGHQLIHLGETIRNGGVDTNGYPLLAIARSHREWAYVHRYHSGRVDFTETDAQPTSSQRFAVRRLPEDTLPRLGEGSWWRRLPVMRAMVPNIPPELRPRYRLHNYHTLWEAEWLKVPRPPRDPYLLKHVGGDLYAVLAAWDLTEVERAVLAHRG